MARLSQGILGGISGKIGNLVGSSWKGIAVIKTKALSVANPQTAAQISQRSAMSLAVSIATACLADVIKPLNDRFAAGMSGFNVFVSRNISLFVGGVVSAYASIRFSVGKMVAVTPTTLVADVSLDLIRFTFPAIVTDSYAQQTDEVYIVAIDATTGEVFSSGNSFTRADAEAQMSAGGKLVAGNVIHGYLMFRRNDGTVVSNTGYLSTVTIA